MNSSIDPLARISICFFFAIAVVDLSIVKGQSTEDTVMIKMIALRDDFIGKIKAMGFTPSLKAPEIVVDNPRSFRNHDDSTNILHTGDWKTLPANLQAIFNKAPIKTHSRETTIETEVEGVSKYINQLPAD
jgi:hypothetical protein